MKLIVFSKCTKFYVDCKNGKKIWENAWSFWDNGLWTCCGNFSQLWGEYVWLAVNVLPESPQISRLTTRNVFQLNLSCVNRKLRRKCCRANFSSVCHPWTCWLSIRVLKQELSVIEATIFLGVNNFRNIEAMKLTFPFEMR